MTDRRSTTRKLDIRRADTMNRGGWRQAPDEQLAALWGSLPEQLRRHY